MRLSLNTGTEVFGGRVLLYNSELPYFSTQCADNAHLRGACFGAISLRGSSATTQLKPIQTGMYKGMVIF